MADDSCYGCLGRDPQFQCSGCKQAVYCSVKCQREHWDMAHRRQCPEWRPQQASVSGDIAHQQPVGPEISAGLRAYAIVEQLCVIGNELIQQDAIVASKPFTHSKTKVSVSAVIDGFGSLAGDRAKDIAQRVISASRYDPSSPMMSLRNALNAVDVALKTDPTVVMGKAGVSCVLTLFTPSTGELSIASVGNCRAIVVRDKRFKYKTPAHTWNEAREAARFVDAQQRAGTAWSFRLDDTTTPPACVNTTTGARTTLSRALGPTGFAECGVVSMPSVRVIRIKPGRDRLIMGTSGVWRVLGTDQMLEVLIDEFDPKPDDGREFALQMTGMLHDEAISLEQRTARLRNRAPRASPYPLNTSLIVQSFKFKADKELEKLQPPDIQPHPNPAFDDDDTSPAAAAAADGK